MACFSTKYDETFAVGAPIESARSYFGDLDRLAENLENVEHVERVGADVLWVRMEPLVRGPVSFRGEYRCRYRFPSENVLAWEPAGPGSISMRGEARFASVRPAETRVEFHQAIDVEIEMNRFLAPLASPVVNLEMQRIMRRYLERARATLGAPR